MAIDPVTIIDPIIAAMQPALSKGWNDVADYARGESVKMAQTLAQIAEMKATHKINEQQAEALLDMQRHASQTVLLAVEGIGLVAAQNAINAALDAVKLIVNKAAGFALI